MKNILNQENTRISSFDYIKAFCIFLVCLGHALLYIFTDMDYSYPVTKYIYAFHMPLFMTVSGFFFASTLKKDFVTVLKEKGIQLLLPCFSFFLLIKIFRLEANLNFWYLKCLFVQYVVFYLLCKFQKALNIHKILYWTLIIFIFLVVAPFINRWLIVTYKIMFMFPFFGVGVLVRNEWKFVKKFEIPFCIVSFITSIIAILLWKTEYIIYFTPIKYLSFNGFDKKLFFASIMRWGTGIVISLFLILLFDLLIKDDGKKEIVFSKIIKNVGQHSMEIYLLQSFVLEFSFIDFKKYELNIVNYKYIWGGYFQSLQLQYHCCYHTLSREINS